MNVCLQKHVAGTLPQGKETALIDTNSNKTPHAGMLLLVNMRSMHCAILGQSAGSKHGRYTQHHLTGVHKPTTTLGRSSMYSKHTRPLPGQSSSQAHADVTNTERLEAPDALWSGWKSMSKVQHGVHSRRLATATQTGQQRQGSYKAAVPVAACRTHCPALQ